MRSGDYQPDESTRTSWERDTPEGKIAHLAGLLRDERTAHQATRLELETLLGNGLGGLCSCGNRWWNRDTGACSRCGSLETSADKLSIAEHRATNETTEE